jgi:CheY-like chemotaxis protein
MGFDVHVAPDGEVASRLARENQYELIFMDIQMPNMNGLEATTEIRAAGVTSPIIAVTASALKQDMDKCYQAGMDDYLTKPFKKTDLEPLLEKWIGARSSQPDSEKHGEPEPTGSEDKEVFDWEEAVQTFMGEAQVVRELVVTYRQKAEADLTRARKSLESGDFEGLREAAHSIKGSSLNLSIRRLGGVAAALQDAATEKDAEKAGQLVKGAERAYQELVQALPRILG